MQPSSSLLFVPGQGVAHRKFVVQTSCAFHAELWINSRFPCDELDVQPQMDHQEHMISHLKTGLVRILPCACAILLIVAGPLASLFAIPACDFDRRLKSPRLCSIAQEPELL
jgi:hypothetical protein